MAESTFRFVLQDESAPYEAPAGDSARGGTSESPAGGGSAATGTNAAPDSAARRAKAPTDEPVPGHAFGGAQSYVAKEIGDRLDRLPVFGEILKTLDRIAKHTKAFEPIGGAAGLLNRAIDFVFGRRDAEETTPAPRRKVEVVSSGPSPGSRPAAGAARKESESPPPAARDSGGLSPEEAAELFEKYGLRPDQIAGRTTPGSAAGENPPGGRIPVQVTNESGQRVAAELIPAGSNASPGAASGAAGGAGAAGRTLIPAAAEGGGGALIAGGGEAAASGGGALAALGPIGLAIGAAAIAVVAVVGLAVVTIRALIEANNALRKQIEKEAERFRPFSAEIQLGDARSEIAKLRQDVAQARDLGAQISRFNQAQASIDRSLNRVVGAVEGPLLDAVVPLVERVAYLVEQGSKAVEFYSEIGRQLGAFKPTISYIADGINRLTGAAEEQNNKLPPEADILGAFTTEPDLAVNWNGRRYGANDSIEPAGGAEYAAPLPLEPMR